MRKLLNTLYVLSPNAYLQKDGENVVVRIDDQESFRIPIINLESIISFSYLGASPGLMNLCTRCGVTLSFHTPRGQYIGSLEGEVRGNVLLRRTQFRYADDEVMSSHYAAAFIAGKIANQRSVLARFLRDHHPEDSVSIQIQEVITQLKILIQTLSRRSSRAQVMGVEGTAAQLYFGVFQHLILNKDFSFNGRSKRPPKDAINTLHYALTRCSLCSQLCGTRPLCGILAHRSTGASKPCIRCNGRVESLYGRSICLIHS